MSSTINEFEVATTSDVMMSAGPTAISSSDYPPVPVCAPASESAQFALADLPQYHDDDDDDNDDDDGDDDDYEGRPKTQHRKRKIDKKPYTRSRDGCFTCRLRRKKCSEERPFCQTCVKLGIPCEYQRPIWWYDQKEKKEYKSRLKDIIQQNKFQMKHASRSSKPKSSNAPTRGRVAKSVSKPRGSVSSLPRPSAPLRPPPYSQMVPIGVPEMRHPQDYYAQPPLNLRSEARYYARAKSHGEQLAYYPPQPIYFPRPSHTSGYPPPDSSHVCPSKLHGQSSYHTEQRSLPELTLAHSVSPTHSSSSFDIVDRHAASVAGSFPTTQDSRHRPSSPPDYKSMMCWDDGATTGHGEAWPHGLFNEPEPLPSYAESNMKCLDEQRPAKKDEPQSAPVDPALELLDLDAADKKGVFE